MRGSRGPLPGRREVVKSRVAGVHASVDHQASVGLHGTKLAPSAQRDPDPVAEPLRPRDSRSKVRSVSGSRVKAVLSASFVALRVWWQAMSAGSASGSAQ